MPLGERAELWPDAVLLREQPFVRSQVDARHVEYRHPASGPAASVTGDGRLGPLQPPGPARPQDLAGCGYRLSSQLPDRRAAGLLDHAALVIP